MSTQVTATRTAVTPLVAGGTLTLLSAVLVQAVVIPLSDVDDDRFSYPWSPSALIWVSILYVGLHVLVAQGLWLVRDRATSPALRAGLATAVVGTLFLLAGEVGSIAIRDAMLDDTSAGVVGGVLFGGGTLLTGVGLLVAGIAAVRAGRSRFSLAVLVAGVWALALLGLVLTPVMALAIGVYGLTLALVGVTAREI